MGYWLPWERVWLHQLLAAMVPPGERHAGLLDTAQIDAFLPLFCAAAPPLVGNGLRASVWGLTLLPMIWPGFWRPLPLLRVERRDAFLVAADASRFFLLRQMVLVVKLAACMTLCSDPATRGRLDGAVAR